MLTLWQILKWNDQQEAIMPSRLLIFNCSTDMALASGKDNYTPPPMIQSMERELELLPLWWADDGDVVMVSDIAQAETFLRELNERLDEMGLRTKNVCFADWKGHLSNPSLRWSHLRPVPWGWNRDVARRCLRLGVCPELIPDHSRLEKIRQLSNRRFAVEYVGGLLSFFGRQTFAESQMDSSVLLGEDMTFVSGFQAFSDLLDAMIPDGAVILKAPWSSSGKGNLVLSGADDSSLRWARSVLEKQGGLCVDRFYDKRLDFAMEFCVHPDATCTFLGYSLFSADECGRYVGNMVADQHVIHDNIVASGVDSVLLDHLVRYHLQHLPQSLGSDYEGVVGIDMMVAEVDGQPRLHPCIEINLRMNMGVVALHLANQHIVDLDLTPADHPHFRAKVKEGRFLIEKSK